MPQLVRRWFDFPPRVLLVGFLMSSELAPALAFRQTIPEPTPAPAPEDPHKVTAGFDPAYELGGFYIRSDDERFRLNFGGFAQFRWDVNRRQQPPPDEDQIESGLEIARTRLFFTGNYTEQFDYHLRLNVDSQGDVSLVNAWGQWNVGDSWYVRMGEQFIALSREDWMFAPDVLGSDYSANDATFALGPSVGVQANYGAERYRAWMAFSNGTSGGKSDFGDTEGSEGAISGRFEYQLEGKDWSIWDDLNGRRGREPGMLIGVAAFAESLDGADNPKNNTVVTGDLSFSGDGWQTLFYGTARRTTPNTGGAYENYGLLAQGGYFVTEKNEVFGRYEFISPGSQPGDLSDFNSVTVGWNYFPFDWGNKWKLTAEFSYLLDPISNTIVDPSPTLGFLSADEGTQWYFRVQMQFGF